MKVVQRRRAEPTYPLVVDVGQDSGHQLDEEDQQEEDEVLQVREKRDRLARFWFCLTLSRELWPPIEPTFILQTATHAHSFPPDASIQNPNTQMRKASRSRLFFFFLLVFVFCSLHGDGVTLRGSVSLGYRDFTTA